MKKKILSKNKLYRNNKLRSRKLQKGGDLSKTSVTKPKIYTTTSGKDYIKKEEIIKFDDMSKLFHDSISTQAVFNPDNFTEIKRLTLNKTKLGKTKIKTQKRSVFIDNDVTLKWETGFASSVRASFSLREDKGVSFENMNIGPLKKELDNFYFNISNNRTNERYKFEPFFDRRESKENTIKNFWDFYRTLLNYYLKYESSNITDLRTLSNPSYRTNSEEDQIKDYNTIDLSFDKDTLELEMSVPVNKKVKVDYIYPIINETVRRPYNFVILTEDNEIYFIGYVSEDPFNKFDNILYNFVFMVNNFSIMNNKFLNTQSQSSLKKSELFRYGYYGGEDCSNYYIFDKEDFYKFGKSGNKFFDIEQFDADFKRATVFVNGVEKSNIPLTDDDISAGITTHHEKFYQENFSDDDISAGITTHHKKFYQENFSDLNIYDDKKDIYNKNIATFILQTVNAGITGKWLSYTIPEYGQFGGCGDIIINITDEYIHKNVTFDIRSVAEMTAQTTLDTNCNINVISEIYSRFDSNYVFCKITTSLNEIFCEKYAHLQGGKKKVIKSKKKSQRKNKRKSKRKSRK